MSSSHRTDSRITRPALFAVLMAGAGACSPLTAGRVVSDIRVADGYISVDRCVLQRTIGGVRVGNCRTENYYIGKTVIPIHSTGSEAPE